MREFHADRLRAFIAVAQNLGFTKGARQLGRSQSSVSQAVALLEEELGESLFVRDGRTIELTEAGVVLLGHAQRAFAELEQARVSLAARRSLDTGSLVLGSTDTLAIYLLPVVFAAFRKRYPGIEVTLVNRTSPTLAQQVAQRAVDLAIVSLPIPAGARFEGSPLADHVHVDPLIVQRDVVICPPDHALAHRKRIDLAGLDGHALVLLDRSTATRALLEERFAELGVQPNVVMEMSSVEVLKRLVELGFGASVVPAMSAKREIALKTLVSIPLRGLGRERRVGILTPTAGPLSHAARAFIELTRQELKAAARDAT